MKKQRHSTSEACKVRYSNGVNKSNGEKGLWLAITEK